MSNALNLTLSRRITAVADEEIKYSVPAELFNDLVENQGMTSLAALEELRSNDDLQVLNTEVSILDIAEVHESEVLAPESDDDGLIDLVILHIHDEGADMHTVRSKEMLQECDSDHISKLIEQLDIDYQEGEVIQIHCLDDDTPVTLR